MVSGDKISLSELCDIVNRISSRDMRVYVCREGLAKEYTASNERFLSECSDFAFTAKETAIKALYDWYKDREEMIDLYKLLY